MRSLPVLEGARRRFGATAVYVLSLRCRAACRHCSVRAGPDGAAAAGPAEVASRVGELARLDGLRVLAFSGGEPLEAAESLAAGLAAAKRAGVSTVVFSNGAWAADPSAARRALASLPPFDMLELSASSYHEERIPLSNLGHAARAALARGTAVWFQVTSSGEDGRVARLRAALGEAVAAAVEVSVAPLLPVGRAADQGPAPEPSGPPSPRPCRLAGQLLVRPDGSVAACCSESLVDRRAPPALDLGRLGVGGRGSAAARLARARRARVLRALRALGPARCADLAGPAGPRVPAAFPCDDCLALLSSPDRVERLLRALGRQAVREELALLCALDEGLA